jgi:hypothetical protein
VKNGEIWKAFPYTKTKLAMNIFDFINIQISARISLKFN